MENTIENEVITINPLVEKLQTRYEDALAHAEALKAELDEGILLAEQLPDFIQKLSWWAFHKRGEKEWYLETPTLTVIQADELVKEFRLLGAYGMKANFKGYGNNWSYSCSIIVYDDTKIDIKIDGGSKPLNCRIEETKEMKEVITYKAICPETNEEL